MLGIDVVNMALHICVYKVHARQGLIKRVCCDSGKISILKDSLCGCVITKYKSQPWLQVLHCLTHLNIVTTIGCFNPMRRPF